MPKVSVIVPNYNHAPFLRQRIDTILAQTFQDFELILLDDCSTDDSRSILSSYSGDSHVRAIEFNETNSGSTFKQWNKGVRLAHGEYIWIAESDDYSDRRFLERLIPVLDAKPQVVLASSRSWVIAEDGTVQSYADSGLPHWARYEWGADVDGQEDCQNHFVVANAVCNASSVLFRRTVYEHVGGADENLRYTGDWKIWAAMALTGRIVYLSDSLNYYRIHEITVSAGSKREGLAQAEYLHVMRWLLGKVTPAASARQEIEKNLAWLWLPAVTTWRMPVRRRYSILRDAIAIAPINTLGGVIPEAVAALRRKFLRHWYSIRSASKVT